jgi:homoserine dehydrogenase
LANFFKNADMKKKVKEVKIGILGLGVVGSELVEQIRCNAPAMESEYGIRLVIKHVYVKNITKTRTIDTNGLSLTDNVNQIATDPEISVICECLGGNGYKETKDIVLTCLNSGKHVIMSSKKALAHNAEIFIDAANTNRVYLKYDATVGGGIPIGKVIGNAFRGDKITEIRGIFNATSNFIYSQMSDNGLNYAEALKIAQDKGYAENDPSDDVDGFDATNKLVILSLFAAKTYFKPSEIIPVSFTSITKTDMDQARQLGYTIKPMASLILNGTGYKLSVGPCLVASNSIYACTPSNYNTIVLKGKNCGELAFCGQGAGGAPTASAMFDDLVNIIQHKGDPEPFQYISNNDKSDIDDSQRLVLKVISGREEENIENWLKGKGAIVEKKQKTNGNKGFETIYLVSGIKVREIEELNRRVFSKKPYFCSFFRMLE